MHPKALTGRRDARSVYNFGRILTDRIDSQSARNGKWRAYGPPFLFWMQPKGVALGNDAVRAPVLRDSVRQTQNGRLIRRSKEPATALARRVGPLTRLANLLDGCTEPTKTLIFFSWGY
jgi:hypothetical protein